MGGRCVEQTINAQRPRQLHLGASSSQKRTDPRSACFSLIHLEQDVLKDVDGGESLSARRSNGQRITHGKAIRVPHQLRAPLLNDPASLLQAWSGVKGPRQLIADPEDVTGKILARIES